MPAAPDQSESKKRKVTEGAPVVYSTDFSDDGSEGADPTISEAEKLKKKRLMDELVRWSMQRFEKANSFTIVIRLEQKMLDYSNFLDTVVDSCFPHLDSNGELILRIGDRQLHILPSWETREEEVETSGTSSTESD